MKFESKNPLVHVVCDMYHFDYPPQTNFVLLTYLTLNLDCTSFTQSENNQF